MYLSPRLSLLLHIILCSPLACVPSQMSEPHPDSIEGTRRKRKPSTRIIENGDPLVARKRTKSTVSVPTTTQSSTTSSSSTDPISNVNGVVSSSPPCAQPRAPEDSDSGDNDTASKGSDSEPIEVSDGDDDSVEVIEDDDEELGKCSCSVSIF